MHRRVIDELRGIASSNLFFQPAATDVVELDTRVTFVGFVDRCCVDRICVDPC